MVSVFGASPNARVSSTSAMVNASASSSANGAQQLCFYIPSPLHPEAYTRCEQLGVDVIHPKDPRSKTWYECEMRSAFDQVNLLLTDSSAKQMPTLSCGGRAKF